MRYLMEDNPLVFWLGLVLVLLGRAWYDLWQQRAWRRLREQARITAVLLALKRYRDRWEPEPFDVTGQPSPVSGGTLDPSAQRALTDITRETQP